MALEPESPVWKEDQKISGGREKENIERKGNKISVPAWGYWCHKKERSCLGEVECHCLCNSYGTLYISPLATLHHRSSLHFANDLATE